LRTCTYFTHVILHLHEKVYKVDWTSLVCSPAVWLSHGKSCDVKYKMNAPLVYNLIPYFSTVLTTLQQHTTKVTPNFMYKYIIFWDHIGSYDRVAKYGHSFVKQTCVFVKTSCW
jgi:hypothetical protein